MDLHGHRPSTIDDIDAVDKARAQEYALLATVLGRAPDADLLRFVGMRARSASPMPRLPKLRAAQRGRASSANISISSSGSVAASFCLTVRTISRGFCTSAHLRAYATT